MSLPKRQTEDQAANERPGSAGLDLPEWLIDLKPVSEPERPAPVAKMVSHPKAASDKPAASPQEPWQPAASSLVSEDDLPAWLKELSDEQPVEPVILVPQPESQPAESSMTPPAWVGVAPTTVEDEEPASAAVEPPPVWAARRVKARPEEPVIEPLEPVTPAETRPESASLEVKGRRPVNAVPLVALLLIIFLIAMAAVFVYPMLT